MSGRPDPAARWGEADAPADGEPRDANGGAAAPKEEAAGGGREQTGAAADPSGTDSAESGTTAEPRSIRSVPGPGDSADGAGAILTDVAALAAERDDYLQALQRLKADFDNYRKRVARLQDEQAARAAAALVQKILPVLDNLDLAVAHLVKEEPATEDARALSQARDQLLDVLAREGLERVDATGVPFDPTVHDAVAHAPAGPAADERAAASTDTAEAAGTANAAGAEASAGAPSAARDADTGPAPAAPADPHPAVVDEVMRSGYRWRGQVLRPAMVRVRG